MPFPDIKYCMICTGVKLEMRGKLTIVGFFGLSPEVFMDINFPPGIAELSFLMQGGASDGRSYGLSFKIVDQTGNPLHTQPVEEFVDQRQPRTYVIFESVRVRYPRPGKYRLQLIVDGAVHYEAPFELFRSGAPPLTSNSSLQGSAERPEDESPDSTSMGTTDKERRRAVLQASVDALYQSANGFVGSPAHLLSDGVLMQLGYDVYEQAVATLIVTNGPSARAAVANARAALEAAIDMHVLLAEPSLYDERGSFVRVCELLSNEDNRKYAMRAATAAGTATPSVPTISPDEAVAQEARQWEVHQPGISLMYKRVLEQARQEQRWKYHWSGLGNFADRADHVERKNAAPAGFKEMATAWFRVLSLAVHPGPRTGRRSLDYTTGRPLLGPKEEDEAFPLAAARWACDHAVTALALRRTLFPRA